MPFPYLYPFYIDTLCFSLSYLWTQLITHTVYLFCSRFWVLSGEGDHSESEQEPDAPAEDNVRLFFWLLMQSALQSLNPLSFPLIQSHLTECSLALVELRAVHQGCVHPAWGDGGLLGPSCWGIQAHDQSLPALPEWRVLLWALSSHLHFSQCGWISRRSTLRGHLGSAPHGQHVLAS